MHVDLHRPYSKNYMGTSIQVAVGLQDRTKETTSAQQQKTIAWACYLRYVIINARVITEWLSRRRRKQAKYTLEVAASSSS